MKLDDIPEAVKIYNKASVLKKSIATIDALIEDYGGDELPDLTYTIKVVGRYGEHVIDLSVGNIGQYVLDKAYSMLDNELRSCAQQIQMM